jgi:hypothetical protein
MQTLEVFWTASVQGLFKPVKDPKGGPPSRALWASKEELFFSGNWLDKAILAREVGEPMDIANWYFKNKHITNVAPRRMPHYIHGVFVSEYTYASGLQASVGRVGSALGQLGHHSAQPWSASMGAVQAARRGDEVERLKVAVEAVELEAAVAAVAASVSVLNDARKKREPVPTAGYNSTQVEANKQRALAPEKAAEVVLTAKLALLEACTGSLSEHATAILALVETVQGEALHAPPAVWDAPPAVDDDLAPDQGVGGAEDKCAAAGTRELARWVGWRVEELKASVAAVEEAAQVLAVDALETPPLENVAMAVAAAEEAQAKLAAAAGAAVKRVGVRDNDSRPGRYQLIQKQEVRCSEQYGEPPTSLNLARKLQWLGSGPKGIRFEKEVDWPSSIADLLVRPEVSLLVLQTASEALVSVPGVVWLGKATIAELLHTIWYEVVPDHNVANDEVAYVTVVCWLDSLPTSAATAGGPVSITLHLLRLAGVMMPGKSQPGRQVRLFVTTSPNYSGCYCWGMCAATSQACSCRHGSARNDLPNSASPRDCTRLACGTHLHNVCASSHSDIPAIWPHMCAASCACGEL